MITLIRVARVLAILAIAVMTISLIMGIGSPDTGVVEKVVLLGMIAVCVWLAAMVTTVASKLQHRVRH